MTEKQIKAFLYLGLIVVGILVYFFHPTIFSWFSELSTNNYVTPEEIKPKESFIDKIMSVKDTYMQTKFSISDFLSSNFGRILMFIVAGGIVFLFR